MEDVQKDIQLTFKVWRRRPLLAAVILLTLGLGVSAISAIFSVIQAVLLAPLPYDRPEELVVIRAGLPKQRQSIAQLSGPEVVALHERAQSVQLSGGIWPRPAVLGKAQSAIEIEIGWTTPGLLEALGVAPTFGRLPTADEHRRTDVIVLSDSLWRQRFGADTSILGRRIDIDGEPRTVIAVMPEEFRMLFPRQDGIPSSVHAWLPWGGDLRTMPREFRIFTVVGRVGRASTLATVNDDLASVARAISAESVDYARSGFALTADSLPDSLVAPVRPTLLVLLGVVVFVWIIACANVANLLLIRGVERSTEFAVRLALGASRWRLWRQILTESALIGSVGAAAGLLFAHYAIALLRQLDPAEIPRVQEASLDARTLAVSAAVAVISAMFFGLLAARHAASATILQHQARRGASAGTTVSQRLLVIAQVSLSVVLLSGTGALVRSIVQLHAVELGFMPDHVVSVRVSLPDGRYPYATDGLRIAEFYRRLDEALAAIPGVRSAGATLSPPLADVPVRARPYAYRVTGGEIEWGTIAASYRTVTPGWFQAVGARLIAGRFFDDNDRFDQALVVVVDSRLAAQAWPGKDAVGQPIRVERFRNGVFSPQWGEVFGVVESVRLDSLVRPEREQVYIAHHQAPQRTMFPTILASGDPLSVVPGVRRAVQTLEADLPIFDVRPAAAYVASAMAQTRFAMIALGIFAALAVVLAAAGLYASIAASVTQRTREIGIRLALGCAPNNVFRWTMKQGIAPACVGIGVGLTAAAALSRFLSGLLFNVSATDLPTMAMVTFVVAGISALACWLPAVRAASVDPCESLRA